MIAVPFLMSLALAQDNAEVGVWVDAEWPAEADTPVSVERSVAANFGKPSDVFPIEPLTSRVVKGTGLRLSTEMAPTSMKVEWNYDAIRTLDASSIDITSAHAAANSLIAVVAASGPVWPIQKVEAEGYVVLVAQSDQAPLFDHRITLPAAKGYQHELLMGVMEALAPHYEGRGSVSDQTMATHECGHDGGDRTAREHVLAILQACHPAPYIPYYGLRTNGPDWTLGVTATNENSVTLDREYPDKD